LTARRTRVLRARVWAALVVGFAARGVWAVPEDDLPDPPLSGSTPTTTPPPVTPAPKRDQPPVPPPSRDKPSAPSAPAAKPPAAPVAEPAPATIRGPAPWPTVAGVELPAAPAVEARVATREPTAPPKIDTAIIFFGQTSLLVDRDQDTTAQLALVVAGIEHRSSSWLRLVAAAELEQVHRFGMERLFVEAAPHAAFGVRAGLVPLPLGLVNPAPGHLPTAFPTVDRPLTDRLILPTTWREVGVGIFGALGDDARYELALTSGLDAAGFSATAPLWGGRGNGRTIAFHDAAVVGRLEIGRTPNGFAIGGGGYWGGASGGREELADVRVAVAEADARFRGGGFDIRAQIAEVFIVNSYRVNDYLGLLGQDAVPAVGRGFYGQVGCNVLEVAGAETKQQLTFFAGYENVNPRSRMSTYNFNPPAITGPGELPPNSPSPSKSFVRGGISYQPLAALAIKADVQVALGAEGPPPLSPMTAVGAPGTPQPLPGHLSEAARGQTRVGFALAWAF
jgi:hypothetical protein